MASNEEVIFNSITDATVKDLVEIDRIDFEQLKIASNTFIRKVEDIFNRVNHTHMIIKGNTIKKGLRQFYQLMRDSTTFTQEALQLQHEFESELNKFLGRIIYLTWVDESGHMLYFDDANIGKIYANATANRGRGNISATKMKEVADINDLTGDLRKRLEESQRLRIHVYQIAVARWAGNQGEEIKDYDPSKKTFYWRLYDNHHISGWTDPIATKGVIAEGYAGAVINQDPQVISSNLEFSLKNLYENHIQKDSVGAAIKGDVVWDQNGNVQFAIKEGSFSTARFGQYLNLAYNTIQIKTMTAQQYEKILPRLVRIGKATNKILEEINKNAEERANEEVRKVAPLV